jgi:hypothetical protein
MLIPAATHSMMRAQMVGVLNAFGVVDLLLAMGVEGDTAYELSLEYDWERIEQVITHYKKLREMRALGPWWIVSCLRGDWLPHLLYYGVILPCDRYGMNRLENLLLGGSAGFVDNVVHMVGNLTKLEWEGLAAEVVRREESKSFKREMRRNPTKSNWILCEKVYALHNRGYLRGAQYEDYLRRRTTRVTSFRKNPEK